MLVKLMLYRKNFKSKPTGFETVQIQGYTEKKTGKYHAPLIVQDEIEIEDLSKGLCNGMTCKPALLNGTKSSDWIQQQVFALDFDHDTTIERELKNCTTLGIVPAFGYTSFSHSEEEHHFRLVFVTDEVITDVDKRNKLQITLIKTFDKSDKVTFDPTRIFYGGSGKQPIQPNYGARINADDIIERYYKEEYAIYQSNTKVKSKSKTKKERAEIAVPTHDYLQNIDAIKSLNACKLREILSSLEGDSNKKDYNNLILSLSHSSYKCKSEQQVYDVINSIDIHSFLGIQNGATINCILPNHKDNSPSAHIYTTDNGTQVYKCFGCNKSRTIIGLVEELAHCRRRDAINFIKKVYNIELVQSDWAKEQKEIMIESANYLDTEEFKTQFPNMAKIIRTRKIHIQKMLLHFTQHISDNMQYDNKPLFFGSYTTLLGTCGIKGNMNTLSQSITLFTLLNMLSKVELVNIPEDELNKAKHISAKYGFKKLTNFYQFEEYGCMSLENSENIAKVLIDNNISLRGLSREYILRTFGKELADKVYPQYKYENNIGTSEKSDKKTMKIAAKILDTIEKDGFILEKDIKRNNKTETQWKRSIQEILDTYGLVKVKASKANKEKYRLPSEIPYQSFVICHKWLHI